MFGKRKSFDRSGSVRETRKLPHDNTPIMPARRTGPLDAGLGPPWMIQLSIIGTPVTLQVHITKEIIIGRSDARTTQYPDIDLTAYGGLMGGVSRQHACIQIENGRLVLVDLKSKNGTRVNGYCLQPNTPCRLRHGDDLEIGHVKMQVAFTLVPMGNVLHDSNVLRRGATPIVTYGDGQHVLLVESDPETASILTKMLNAVEYRVTSVQTTRAAQQSLARQMPDLIVLDLVLPKSSGLELCRYVRREQHAHTPIIALSAVTAKSSTVTVNKALKAGADAFLSKPVGLDELTHVMADLLAVYASDDR